MNQEQAKHEHSRKTVALWAGIIIGALTLVSVVASFQIYKESFRDCWPFLAGIFALLITAGVEVAFILLVHAMSKAYMGKEMLIAGVGAALLLGVMAINFVVHSHIARVQPLTDFEIFWRDYIGLIVPFATIGLFTVLAYISPEAANRRQLRRMHFIGQERALNFKEEYLQSPELENELAQMQPMIAREVRGYIASTLPNSAQGNKQARVQLEPSTASYSIPKRPRRMPALGKDQSHE